MGHPELNSKKAMTVESIDAAVSDPLLSSHSNEEGEENRPREDIETSEHRKTGGFIHLLRSKYVISCALFSSVGGLVFGYGIRS